MYMITPEMGEVPPHWMGYIAVDDVDAVVKKNRGTGRESLRAPYGYSRSRAAWRLLPTPPALPFP